jgi:hypothetical protein
MAGPLRMWPSRLPPYRDESFYSWIIRVAARYEFSLSALVMLATGVPTRSRRDWDRCCDPRLLSGLALRTGISPGRLRASTFSRFAQCLGLIRPTARGHQLCSHCLQQDASPHHRLVWRLGFVVACNDHYALLVDRCDQCGARLRFFERPRTGSDRWRRDPTGLCLCSNCGFDLRDSKPVGLPYGELCQALAVQKRLLVAAALGHDFGATSSFESTQAFFTAMLREMNRAAWDYASRDWRVAPLHSGVFLQLRTWERALILGARGLTVFGSPGKRLHPILAGVRSTT